MKRILLFLLLFVSCISVFNVISRNIDNQTLLSIVQVDNLAYGEITIVPVRGQDATKSCKTTKVVQISIGDGKFEYQTISVTGLENPCKPHDQYTCQAFACYAN